MTLIYANDDAEGMHQLIISGHTGYAKKGSDIICAGISAISTAYINQVNAHDDIFVATCDVAEGFTELTYEDTDNLLAEARMMAVRGLEAIADAYPDYVIVEHSARII